MGSALSNYAKTRYAATSTAAGASSARQATTIFRSA